MAPKNDAIASGILSDGVAHHESQLKARPLPGNPDQRVIEFAVKLVHLCLAVCGCSESDAPVGVKMIHMWEGQKSMQWRIDGGGHRIVAEGTDGVHAHHVVFGVDTFIDPLESEQLFLVECGKSSALDAAQVAARTFDPEHFHSLASQRVRLRNLGAGVAAGKVGDAQVRSEQVRTITQELRFIKRSGYAGVPAIFKEAQSRRSDSCQSHRHHCTRNWTDTVKISLGKAIENRFLM